MFRSCRFPYIKVSFVHLSSPALKKTTDPTSSPQPPRNKLAVMPVSPWKKAWIESKWGSLTLEQKDALMQMVDVFHVGREEGRDENEIQPSSSSSPAKRVGRPPKVLASKSQAPGGGLPPSSSALEGPSSSSEPKKRRGRPPKAATEAKAKHPSGRKRGRPPTNPRPKADDAGMEEEEEEEEEEGDLADGGASSSSAPPQRRSSSIRCRWL